MASQIIMNGKSYHGNNITIRNNQVIVDGDIVGSNNTANQQLIFITGNIENLHVDSSDVDVDGNVGVLKTTSGDVNVLGHVNMHVTTTSGDVKVKGDIKGNAKTVSGDIKYRKK